MDPLCLSEQTLKSQGIRLLDVLVIGPLMIAGGNALAANPDNGIPSKALGVALSAFGVGAILLNGRNYLRVRAACRLTVLGR